jgi:hypothetical protein
MPSDYILLAMSEFSGQSEIRVKNLFQQPNSEGSINVTDSRRPIGNNPIDKKRWLLAMSGKNYSIRDSRLVTHDNTSRTISCLNSAERTGCVVFMIL